MLTDPDVIAAEASVVKVRGTNGCGGGVEGTGFFYAPGRLMTNAHVVAGVTRPEVEVGGTSVTASVVLYDPALDVAVLSLPDTGSPSRSPSTPRSSPATRWPSLGYPEDGPYDVEAGRIRSEQRLRSPDIYGEGTVIRQVFSLRGLIRPGNSGGPIVTSAGDVVGHGLRRVGHRPRHRLRAHRGPGGRVGGARRHRDVPGRHRHLRALSGRTAARPARRPAGSGTGP